MCLYKKYRLVMYPLSSSSRCFFFFFSSRRRHTRFDCDWSSDVCSSDLALFFLPMFFSSSIEFLSCFYSSVVVNQSRINLLKNKSPIDRSFAKILDFIEIGRAHV